jgi:tetratricopeptide (TPR) repeat protein
MRVAIPFALFLSAAALHAAAPEKTRQKLRSLAMLPSLSFSFSTYTTDLRYPELAVSQQELIGRINDLQRKLRESPDEPGLELELGRFLRAVGRTNESNRAAAKAIELFRPRAHDAPRDIGVQIDFAHALEAAGNLDEAESVLRRSVAIATNEWRCWDGLGELLDAKEEIVLGGTQWASTTLPLTDQFTFSSGSSVPAVLLSNPPPAALIKEAESAENEADRCFDRAVTLAPAEAQAYIARVQHRSGYSFVRRFLNPYRQRGKLEEADWQKGIIPVESCQDLASVARLDPTNYNAIAFWAALELTSSLTNKSDDKPIDRIPPSHRTNVLEAMRLLENLGEHHNPRIAAGALERLGILRMLAASDQKEARTAFQRAIVVDPSWENAWEALVGVTSLSSDPNEFVMICSQRVKHADNVRNRVALAKAYDVAKQPIPALEQARAAVKLGPTDPLARLCLVGLLLHKWGDQSTKGEAIENITAAYDAMRTIPNSDVPITLIVTYNIDQAIGLALDGQMDQAREFLRQFATSQGLDNDVKDRIKDIQSVIGN